VGVLHIGALTEEGIRLVEKEKGPGALGVLEDCVEVLLRLADVLAHDTTEIDRHDLRPGLIREHLGRHRFARTVETEHQRTPTASGFPERDQARNRFGRGRRQFIRHLGNAKATIALPEGAPFLPPPQAMTTYCRPLS